MIGVRLGPWVIEQEVGRGGMGAVYKARRADDAPLGPPAAAVKVLAAELAVEVGFQQRFGREIDILRQLDHPGIVRLYDSGHDHGRFWFAMEFIDGTSFEDLRDRRGRLPWGEVLEMACQVAPALKHAHDRGVIHRDIKPANLLREDKTGRTKLTDFGIASLFASPHLTVTGGVIGTPEYLSPEQAAGKPVTKKSDLYSLGVCLYALVTGQTPFVGEPIDLLHKHRFAQFDRPGRVVPDLHPDFEEAICNLLEKDPSARPGDAGVLYRRLESIRKKSARQRQGETIARIDDRTPPPREGPATMASRVVREELKRLNRPGPIGRFVNQPIVLVTLFVLCVAALAWTFWPSSARTLYERGAALMASDDPDDQERAVTRYLDPLDSRHPDHPYQDEVKELRQRYEASRKRKLMGEGQWHFERGLRLRREGKADEARRQWQALIDAYADVPAERQWVRRAREELARKDGAADEMPSLREALRRARVLDGEGKAEDANRIRTALRALYRGDETATAILDAD